MNIILAISQKYNSNPIYLEKDSLYLLEQSKQSYIFFSFPPNFPPQKCRFPPNFYDKRGQLSLLKLLSEVKITTEGSNFLRSKNIASANFVKNQPESPKMFNLI